MKKIFFLFVIAVAMGNIVNAQSCKCNPNGFNPFVYSYLGETRTVSTGNQFSVKCKTPVKLDGGYKCSYTTPCDVKLKAVLKNAAGVVIRAYAEFSFPFEYEFEIAGNYILEIVPWCNGKKCTTAKFYFTVICDAPIVCKCNDANRWDRFTVFIDNVAKPTVCGSTFTIKKDQPFGLKGGYKCDGNCNTQLNGKLINTTTGTEQNFPNLVLEGNFPFTIAGQYKLIITPMCGGKTCPPCIFYINVN